MIRRYSELMRLRTFEERFAYLRTNDRVAEQTFAHSRYINQDFYHSGEWRSLRTHVIARDCGCDLAIPGLEIVNDLIMVHHMNPITEDDIITSSDFLLDPEFLITVSKKTHNAIHYGDLRSIPEREPIVRTAGDTRLW